LKKFSESKKAHPARNENLFFTMPSGYSSKIKQANRPGVGAAGGFFRQ
jgi:hypothetical protein